MIVAPGSTSISMDVFFADDAGAAVTGKVAADFPVCKWSGGGNTADTTITLSDLTAITTAHPNDNTAGGVKEREGGWYRLDLPNNMFTAAGRKTLTFAETTNKRILAPPIDVQYVQCDTRQLLGTPWLTPAVAGTPDVNTKQLGGTAQTGGDLYPAISNIAVTSAALNATAGSEVLTTGSDVGGVTNTATLDGVFDSWTDSAGTIDGYYQFDLSGTTNAVAVGVTWDGYLVGAVNTLRVYAYNWGNAAWDQLGTVVGIAGTVVGSQEFDLTSAHTGTGGNLGLVRIRFSSAGLVTATLKTDRILVGYVVTPNTTTPPTAVAIATTLWQDLLSGSDFSTVGSVGKLLKDYVDATISSRVAPSVLPLNFSALGITAAGKVSGVVLVDSLTINNDKTGYSLAASGADAVLVAGQTLPAAIRYTCAILAGKVSGAQSGTETFKDFADATAVVVTVDASGNRTAVVLS